jgi:hypothetical protein
MDGQEALDVDTGTVFKQPQDMDQWSEEGLGQWVNENGVDLFVDHGPGGVWGLVTTTDADLKLALVENGKWDVISKGELVTLLADNSTPLQITTQGRMKVHVPPPDTQPPMTFAFKTSSGGVGLLQITGYTENPRGVKISYKLVREGRDKMTENNASPVADGYPSIEVMDANLSTGAPAMSNFFFGPVIEYTLPDPDDQRGGGETLNLQTGALTSEMTGVPGDGGERIARLLASTGDLYAEYDGWVSKRWGLITSGLKLSDLTPSQWEAASASDITHALAVPTVVDHITPKEFPAGTLYLLPEGLQPMTFAFQTRLGACGILQITGFTDNPRGVKIRYKLARNPVSPSVQANADLPANRSDQIAVEDLALRMIVAIRERDNNTLKSLATDRIKGWRDALPVVAVELRERYRQSAGNEAFDFAANESLAEEDLAVVRCAGPAKLKGKCLVLFFVKTADGWRNHSLRSARQDVPLANYMADFKKEIQREQSKRHAKPL